MKSLTGKELNKMGLAFVRSKQEAEALKYFNLAVEAEPEYLESHYNRAMVYSVNDKYDEAIACYDAILKKDATQGEACYLKANLLFFHKGNVKDAVELYNKAIYLGYKNEDVYFNLGLCMEASGMTGEALKWVERACIINEKSTEMILKKAELLTNLKRYLEAIECYNQALILESDNEEAFHFKAILLAELKKFDEAIKTLGEAEEIIGTRPIFEYDRAIIYESEGKLEKALLYIDKGLEIDSGNTMFLAKKGSLLAIAGRFEAAKNTYDKIAVLEPDNMEGYFNKAGVHISQKEYAEACNLLETIIQKSDEENPYKINAYYYKALSLKGAGKEEEARISYEEALRNYSTLSLTYTYDVNLMLLKANTLRDLQRFEEAEFIYEYVIDLNKDMAEAYFMRAKNYIYTGNLDKAKKDIESAISINPAYKGLVDLDEDVKSVFNSNEIGEI